MVKPQLGETLFKENENSKANVIMRRWGIITNYARGYLLAGNLLVNEIIKNPKDADKLIYPMIFNYRQALELSLKNAILIGSQVEGEMNVQFGHELQDLWQVCRPYLEVQLKEASETLEAVTSIIAQFAQNDNKSIKYRYPIKGKRENHTAEATFEKGTPLDYRNFAKVSQDVILYINECENKLTGMLEDRWAENFGN